MTRPKRPAPRRVRATLHGFDIEAEMVAECERRAQEARIQNLRLKCRDFLADGTGLPADSIDYAMLFNILHDEQPLTLLHEASRILKPEGRVSVIHWNHDPTTPRGPSMDIRPRPEDCLRWVEDVGFVVEGGIIDLPPYHYGLLGRKKAKRP